MKIDTHNVASNKIVTTFLLGEQKYPNPKNIKYFSLSLITHKSLPHHFISCLGVSKSHIMRLLAVSRI